MSRLFVGRIERHVEGRDVRDAFRRYGPVVAVDMKNGFCFVEFEDPRDAEDALRDMDGREICGCPVIVQRARNPRDKVDRRGGNRGDFRLIVDGLPSHTSWQDLKDFARKYADGVVFTDVSRDNMGIVEFSRESDFRRALRDMYDRDFHGRRVTVFEDRPRRRRRSLTPPRGGGFDRDRRDDRRDERRRDRDRYYDRRDDDVNGADPYRERAPAPEDAVPPPVAGDDLPSRRHDNDDLDHHQNGDDADADRHPLPREDDQPPQGDSNDVTRADEPNDDIKE